MKKMILAAALILGSLQAMAGEKILLECSTAGDALDYVQLIQDSAGKSSVKIGYLSGDSKTLQIDSSLKNIAAGEADTLVAAKDFNDSFGGSISNAALIRVLPGQKSARLAVDGVVYFLNCSKK